MKDDDPAHFDDRGWLLTPFAGPGGRIYGLVHNEFQGHRRPALCPTGRYTDCWYNSITMVFWSAEQSLFTRRGKPQLVAAPRRRFIDSVGHQSGYLGPTNIVDYGDAFAFFVAAARDGEQEPGNCLVQGRDVGTPSTWRAFDGQRFSIDIASNPYEAKQPHKACRSIDPQHLRWPVTSLVRVPGENRFLALMVGRNASLHAGVYVSQSADLLHWSNPQKLLDTNLPSHLDCAGGPVRLYPSLLDPESMSASFATVGSSPFLFYSELPIKNCRVQLLDGQLRRIRLRIIKQ